ncbi:MAG: O-antigen ligase family protein [Caldilineaceae bacterium]
MAGAGIGPGDRWLRGGGVGLVQWLSGGGVDVDGVRRLMGLTFSPNQTALYLLRTLFLLVGVALSRQGRWTWAAVTLTAVALVLTGSRGALLLGVPAGVVALWWLGRGLRRPRAWVWAVLVAALGIGVILLGERLQNSETVLRRFAIWEGRRRGGPPRRGRGWGRAAFSGATRRSSSPRRWTNPTCSTPTICSSTWQQGGARWGWCGSARW